MDWVHCNSCFCQPDSTENRNFFVTNCGHLFCGKCTDGNMKTCNVCSRECATVLIETGMIEEMNLYFNDPDKAIAKQISIMEFQKNHRIKFISHLKSKIDKFKQQSLQLKDEIKRHRDDKNKLKDELIQKNNEIRQLKKQIVSIQTDNMSSRSSKIVSSNRISNNQPQQSLFSLSVSRPSLGNRKPELRAFGSQLQNASSFLQRTASSQQLNFRNLNDNGSSPTVGFQKDAHLFTPPAPISSQNAYRDSSSSSSLSKTQQGTSPEFFSPPMAETPLRAIPSYRRVALPGDKGSLSPIGLNRLSLRTPLSHMGNTTRKGTGLGSMPASTANKYYKYL